MIKIAVRIIDFGPAINAGGDPETTTYIVSVKHPELEKLLISEEWKTKTISVAELKGK